ncbi:hypothetical protein J6590_045846 [Homalodisca vitripennis]|nr:hypothetical protein J6590_045846 [Homalodisca vitripennis]
MGNRCGWMFVGGGGELASKYRIGPAGYRRMPINTRLPWMVDAMTTWIVDAMTTWMVDAMTTWIVDAMTTWMVDAMTTWIVDAMTMLRQQDSANNQTFVGMRFAFSLFLPTRRAIWFFVRRQSETEVDIFVDCFDSCMMSLAALPPANTRTGHLSETRTRPGSARSRELW